MMKILFVCHGNICRSPMAEYGMKHLTRGRDYEIASAATSREEIGNDVYPPARRTLAAHGIPCPGRAARQMTRADYDHYDAILVMDRANLRSIQRITGGDPEGKISLLLDHAGRRGQEVADPWYSGDFEAAWEDILEGCEGLLRELEGQ